MKKISLWAKHHPEWSWIIIIICQLLIYNAGMYTGGLLDSMGIHIPVLVFLISVSLFLLTFLIYPNATRRQQSYAFQKTCDLLIGLSAFVCICFYYNSNTRVTSINAYSSLQGSLFIKAKKDTSANATVTLSKKEQRQQLKKYRSLMRQYKKEHPNDSSGKALVITLIVIGGLLGLGIVAALACSLSCSGADAAALLVGVGGIIGVIWLCVHLIKRVLRKKPTVEK